jgi:YgiT-type zinc finger domain-containing protein
MSGCPDLYEEEQIVQALHFGDGRVIVIDRIPAQVCDTCGDTLIAPDVAEAIEQIRADPPEPSAQVPLYHLAMTARRASVATPRSRADAADD